MFKLHTIGGFDRAINIPYCKLATGTDKVYNGNGVTIDRAQATATLTTASTGKADVWVVYNVIRGVYCGGTSDAYSTAGDFVNLYSLASLVGLEVEISNDAHTFASGPVSSLVAGDKLAYGADGLLSKVSADTGYAYVYKIIAINGDIIRAEVATGTPAAD